MLVWLFSLPFAAVGVFMTYSLWHDFLLSRHVVATWQVVPARIESVELARHRGSKGGTTYEARATYRYVFANVPHTGDRVGLSSGADNIGDFQERTHRALSEARRLGRAVDCYVNPDDPADAVLYPQWRPEMTLFKTIFGLAFGMVGLGMLSACLYGFVWETRSARLKRRHPDEPWLWKPEWHMPVLRSSLGMFAVVAGTILGWINLVTLPLWPALGPAWQADGVFKWILTAMLLAVVVASGYCLRTLLRARKFGRSRLELDKLPLVPGESVVTRLYIPRALPMSAELKIKLACSRKVTTGSGKQRRTDTTVVWNREIVLRGPFAPYEPVATKWTLPADAAQTELGDPDNGHTWELTAEADIPGVDLKLEFELPVFGTSRNVTATPEPAHA